MKKPPEKRQLLLTAIPPWIILGAVAVLFPIFAFMTLESIDRHRSNSERMLLEKGAALIRSFEAGTRTGMMGMRWGNMQLQNLLSETARLPDIEYIFVTDAQGRVIAHNDPEKIGQWLETDLDLAAVARLEIPGYRIVQLVDGAEAFEVFRRFTPTGLRQGQGPGMMGMMHRQQPYPEDTVDERKDPQLIFIGLDMKAVEAARRGDTLHAILMGGILLLIGFAGVLLLFVFQGYRTTRASLSRVQAFSDTLVRHMPIGLVAVSPQGRITFINHVAEDILAIGNTRTVGQEGRDLLPETLWDVAADAAQGRVITEREVTCRRKEGSLSLEAGASPLRDESGSFLGTVLLFKDLSEVRELRREIARSQRLASIGSLAAGVAHEIRNPLSSVKGFATYFKERYGDNPEDLQVADIMIQEVDRLNRVVGQLLEFSKPVDIVRETVPATDFIENSLRLVEKKAAEKDIRLHSQVDARVDRLFIDPGRINQVLLNLYLNAMDAMDRGGSLRVGLTAGPDKGEVRITVADTGPGMDAKSLGRIFDPYFTTKPTGTGLGLPIAHNIVEAHRGDIRIESNPGEGTVVSLTLKDALP